MSNNGSFLPGQTAGFLGGPFEPFVTGDPSLPDYTVPGLTLPRGICLDRVGGRRSLLDAVDHALDDPNVDRLDAHYRKAFSLISSPEARRAFDLTREPAAVRERYGLDPDNPRNKEARQFGGLPHLGPVPAAGPPPDRGGRAGRHRLHRGPVRPDAGTRTASTSRC